VAADAEALARFKREIHVARQVTHHNVCRIYDLGSHRSSSPIAALYPGGEILFVTM
jgi:serine/threonine protein kinase